MMRRGRATLGLIGMGVAAVALGTQPSAADDPRPTPSGGATQAAAPAPSCARRHPGVGGTRVADARQGSTVALVRWGGATIAYVADEDEGAIQTIDVDGGALRATTKLGGSPAQLLVLADGRVAVTLRDRGTVVLLEPGAVVERPLTSLCHTTLTSEPFGIAATPDGRELVVTTAWGHRLDVLDAATLAPRFDIDLPREPRAVLVDDKGERAFVAHVVGAKLSVVDLGERPAVRTVDLAVKRQMGTQLDDRQQAGCQGFALAKSVDVSASGGASDAALDGKELPRATAPRPPPRATPRASPAPSIAPAVAPSVDAPRAPDAGANDARPAGRPTLSGRIFLPMVTVDPGNAAVRSSGYGTRPGVSSELAMVSVVDASAERPMTRSVVGEVGHRSKECLLPRSAVFAPRSSSLLVTCLGVDAVLELDARGLDPSRLERRRWSVPAGPTGVALDEGRERAVVWSQFERALSVVRLDGAAQPAPLRLAPTTKVSPELAAGRILFHKSDDTRISQDGRACASCHPDGRDDALTWSTPDGARQTLMLAGRLTSTEPFGWSGKNPSVREHVTHTLERLQGTGLKADDAQLASLLAYIGSMRGPSTDRPEGEGAALVARGKELFFAREQGCASCHVGGPGTDAARHDVRRRAPGVTASRAPGESDVIDTPSLRFVGGTAPYFHDGRFQTLEDLLASSDHAMGRTLQLGRRDRQALALYMETL